MLNTLKSCHEELEAYYGGFIQDGTVQAEDKFNSILRVIDGKRMLGHVEHRFIFKDVIEKDLADSIAIRDNIPAELTEFISRIRNEAANQH